MICLDVLIRRCGVTSTAVTWRHLRSKLNIEATKLYEAVADRESVKNSEPRAGIRYMFNYD